MTEDGQLTNRRVWAEFALFACAAPDFDEAARKSAREAKLLAFPVAVPAA